MALKKHSKWAVASGVVSISATFILLLSGYGYQWGLWGLGTAFGFLIPASAFLALLGLALAIIFAFSNKKGRPRKSMAAWGAVLGISVLVFVGYWYNQMQQYPPIHDITTDTENPPEFVNIIPLRIEAPNDIKYGGNEVAKVQKEHYPGIQTLYLDMSYSRAYKRALSAALKMSWEEMIAYSEETGRIEATDQLAWFGFKDDIVIRVDTAEARGGSKIDIRSASRIGKGDIGVNAHRIREYLETVQGE